MTTRLANWLSSFRNGDIPYLQRFGDEEPMTQEEYDALVSQPGVITCGQAVRKWTGHPEFQARDPWGEFYLEHSADDLLRKMTRYGSRNIVFDGVIIKDGVLV